MCVCVCVCVSGCAVGSLVAEGKIGEGEEGRESEREKGARLAYEYRIIMFV